MRPDPFCDPGEDGQEPDSCLPPAGQDAEPAGQGLVLCLPAGSLDTGPFAPSGPAADMPPDPLLATIIDTVTGEDGTGLAGLSDDQLIGVIAAVRRLESRTAWYLMAAVAEFTARHAGEGCVAEFAADQLAHELHLTNQSAAAQMDYAATVTSRLPATCAALHAGTIHPLLTGARADHRGRDPGLAAAGRGQRRCGAGGGRGIADVREAARRRAPAGPGAGPRIRGAAQAGRQAGRARAPVPRGLRERGDGRS